MIDIDFSLVTSNVQLADTLDEQFESQTRTFYSSLESNYSNMVFDAGMNCSLLSSVKSIAKQASGQFFADVSNSSNDVESAVSDITKKVGDVIKNIRSSIDVAIIKVQEFSDWIREQTNNVVSQSIAAIEQVINVINSVINQAVSAVSSVVSAINDLALEMAASVKNLALRFCNSMSSAIEEVGTGASIDPTVDIVTAPTEEFSEKMLSSISTKISQYQSSLSSIASGITGGAQQANSINFSFDSIDDLIAGAA